MGDVNHGLAGGREVVNQVEHFQSRLGVEHGRRLVEGHAADIHS